MPGFDVVLAEISDDPISVDRATAAVQGYEAGAVVSFSGVDRGARREGRQAGLHLGLSIVRHKKQRNRRKKTAISTTKSGAPVTSDAYSERHPHGQRPHS